MFNPPTHKEALSWATRAKPNERLAYYAGESLYGAREKNRPINEIADVAASMQRSGMCTLHLIRVEHEYHARNGRRVAGRLQWIMQRTNRPWAYDEFCEAQGALRAERRLEMEGLR